MIKGKVNRNDEPIIPFQLQVNTKQKTFHAIIDTGFNGHISIPEAVIKRTNWQEIGVLVVNFKIKTVQIRTG